MDIVINTATLNDLGSKFERHNIIDAAWIANENQLTPYFLYKIMFC